MIKPKCCDAINVSIPSHQTGLHVLPEFYYKSFFYLLEALFRCFNSSFKGNMRQNGETLFFLFNSVR